MSDVALPAHPPTEIVPELLSLLYSFRLVSTDFNADDDAFIEILTQRGRLNGLHHAIIEILDCVLFRPLVVEFTHEYIDVWGGLWEIRASETSPARWGALRECMYSLARSGFAKLYAQKWHPQDEKITFPACFSSVHNRSTFLHLPWRMNALQIFLSSLLHTGLRCNDLQVEIAQALQVACRQSVSRLTYDLLEHTMLPDEEHKRCMIQLLPLITQSMANAWQTFEAKNDGKGNDAVRLDSASAT
jgi:hypothetical protein